MLPEFLSDKYSKICQDYYTSVKKDCGLCNSDGIIMIDENTYKDCECTKLFLKNKEYIKSGVPITLFQSGRLKFSELYANDCQEKFKKLIRMTKIVNIPINILIHAQETKDYASSLLAGLLAINLIDVEKDVLFIKSYDLIDRFFDFDNPENGWESLISTKFLIIDGWGQENNKQLIDDGSFVYTKFMNLLNNRKSVSGVTIISSDLTLEAMKTKYHKTLIEYFVTACLKFEFSTVKKKDSAIDELTKIHPEFNDIFSNRKVTSFEGENKQPKKGNLRGRSTI